jgi:chromosome segregation ATPase
MVNKIADHVTAAVAGSTGKIEGNTQAVNTLSDRVVSLLEGQQRAAADNAAYFREANTRLASQNTDLTLRVGAFELQVRDLEKRLDTSAQSHNDLLAELEKRQLESAERDRKIEELTQRVGGMGDDLTTTKNKLAQAEKDLADARARIADLERERDTTATEKQRLEAELLEERKKVAELQNEVETLKTQVKDLQAQLDAQKPMPDPDDTLRLASGTPIGSAQGKVQDSGSDPIGRGVPNEQSEVKP